MYRKITISFLVLMAISVLHSCSYRDSEIIENENGIVLKSKTSNLEISFYSPGVVRVMKWLPASAHEKKSLSVIMRDVPKVDFSIKKQGKNLVLQTSELQLVIDEGKQNITFLDNSGSIILQEKSASFTPVVYDNDSSWSVEQKYRLTPDEGIFGLGQHQTGFMNYRGKSLTLVQSNTDAVNPFLISTNGYGILWDNYSKTVYTDDGMEISSLWSDVADQIDYYFVRGDNMDKVIAGYRMLTGHAPMYGKWAYGYWQSKEHYDTQAELMAVAEKYRKLKIPIDNIIQDWDYWNGAQNWSGMFFDKTLFPKPEEMVKRLHSMNFHIIISIWPALGPNTEIYKEMKKNGFLYNPVGWAGFRYYDAFNPAANAMYWKYLRDGLYSVGLDGWWIDSTEPDIVNALTKESTDYEMKKVGSNYLGSWARYMNAFSLVMTDDMYKYWRKETSDRRAYILTRSTYAGQQRNAATTWSGDIGASWKVYRDQISAGINHCMSGIPYWTFDIGAFVLGAYDGVFMNGGKDPAYQELYTRMFQFGTFSPIFRSHGSETPREIWEMGEFSETLIQFDNLRYRLMPYIYSLAWKVTDESYTMMRGLPMDFSFDKKTYPVDDQFMFGPAIMACPVTEFMYYRPPEASVLVSSEHFKTFKGKKGLEARYYKDDAYKVPGKESVDPDINVFWYTGRPSYVSDSMFSVRWEGYIVPSETGPHQFHLKSFDAKRIILEDDTLRMVYTSVEQYTEIKDLKAGKEYKFVLETENRSTGAARMQLFWKMPSTFEKEKSGELARKEREVYLPDQNAWYDFWTGDVATGGQRITSPAPIATMPLFIKAGSIVPMGPFIQYATEKPADPLEIRIYPGADGEFVLYEDENDNYNYENGVYATIAMKWDDQNRTFTIDERKGDFPGMLKDRTMQIVLVGPGKGIGIGPYGNPDKTIRYNGQKQILKF